MSICICFNTEKLENALIVFYFNGPVCIFVAWKIKHNWGESVVKGSEYKEEKKGVEKFRSFLKKKTNKTNPPDAARHMNENIEYFLQKSVSNPYTSREDPGSEKSHKQRWTVTFPTALFSETTLELRANHPATKPGG